MPTLTEAQILAYIAAIQTAINAMATGQIKRYQIGEREFERYDLPALVALLKYYQELLVSIPVEVATVFDDDDV